jgi:hypothetical protein
MNKDIKKLLEESKSLVNQLSKQRLNEKSDESKTELNGLKIGDVVNIIKPKRGTYRSEIYGKQDMDFFAQAPKELTKQKIVKLVTGEFGDYAYFKWTPQWETYKDKVEKEYFSAGKKAKETKDSTDKANVKSLQKLYYSFPNVHATSKIYSVPTSATKK